MNFIETPPETFRLASPNTLEQYAKELYSAFRQADQQGLKEIIVIPPTGNELAFAINDRIIKASK